MTWSNSYTITVEKTDDGQYRATERGNDYVGTGENPAKAVAAYAREIDEQVFGIDNEDTTSADQEVASDD